MIGDCQALLATRSEAGFVDFLTVIKWQSLKMMEWCCQMAKGRFGNRNSYGEFLVAGRMGSVDQILFYSGFLMAHGDDLLGVIGAIRSASDAVGQTGISNFKLSAIGCVQFCSHCGVRLKDHYGSEGGALRDDDFVKQMREFA